MCWRANMCASQPVRVYRVYMELVYRLEWYGMAKYYPSVQWMSTALIAPHVVMRCGAMIEHINAVSACTHTHTHMHHTDGG